MLGQSCAMLLAMALNGAASADSHYFTIEVVDGETGRGVPLVELTTTNEIRYVTDSAGIAAIDEPGFDGQTVFFHVKSHGYQFPADGFGYRGVRLKVVPGGQAHLELKRINIAERLYRVTGAGIYRDSVLLGRPVPLRNPVLNGQVIGQDTVIMTPYRGKLHWFYGDTSRMSYPLGQFAVSGAVSELPDKGGLDPNVGVDLTYFVDAEGFSKKMVPLNEPGLIWIDWIETLPDASGQERLVAKYSRVKSLGEMYGHGLAVFNDEREIFDKRQTLDIPLSEGHRSTHPVRVLVHGREMIYLTSRFHFQRVPAEFDRIGDLSAYEAFTCLKPGSDYDPDHPNLDRAADGTLRWGWKANTAAVPFGRQRELIQKGRLAPEEAWIQLHDFQTGTPIGATPGSIFWNAFRRRWVMIAEQLAGDIWYAEADTPTGPWVYSTRVVRHDRYTFYNPTQHPVFDQDDGRTIFFEGTYTSMFSGNPDKTPRYEYNQMMYRLNLGDPRLFMPVPVYSGKDGKHGLRGDIPFSEVESVPFFAMPTDRLPDGLIPLNDASGKPFCFILPPNRPEGNGEEKSDEEEDFLSRQFASKMLIPVYAAPTGGFVADESSDGAPIGYAWRNPTPLSALDPDALPTTRK